MAVNSEVRVTELTALSEYQREVLLWMRGRYRDSLRYYAANPHMDWHRRNWWGVRLGAADGVSRSQSASMSRSIRRLEQRGLIVRANTRWRNPSSTGPGELERLAKGNHRTTHVLFTPTGWDVAELLDSA